MPDDQNSTIELMNDIASSLRELVKISRIVSYSFIKEKLEKTLNTKEKRLVYLAMDGNNTVSDIQKLANVSNRGNISVWGQEWEKIGIVGNSAISGVKGRRQKLFDLTAFDLGAIEEIAMEPIKDSKD